MSDDVLGLPLRGLTPTASTRRTHLAGHIVHVRDENYRTKTFTLDVEMDAQPGQFAMAWLPGLDERPFSLLSGRPVAITAAAVGPFSRGLYSLGTGDRLWVRGPFGRGFTPRGQNLMLVGGGYGVVPLLFLARSAEAHVTCRAIVGARTSTELLLVEDLRHAGVEVITTTEDGSDGLRGLVTDALVHIVAAGGVDMLCACGPHAMLEALAGLAQRHGVASQLSWEAYMRCAVGLCGSCEFHGRLLCVDGPVLPGP
jgi:dihydroorotate dehydrogenase electron transfer subunit